jgi:hypothetical protein
MLTKVIYTYQTTFLPLLCTSTINFSSTNMLIDEVVQVNELVPFTCHLCGNLDCNKYNLLSKKHLCVFIVVFYFVYFE